MDTCAVLIQLAANPCIVGTNGTPVALAPRDAALLAWLAIEGPTPRTRLIALLWPDGDEEDARNVLRQRLFQLKRQLGAPVVVGSATLALAQGVLHDLEQSDELLGSTAYPQHSELQHWLAHQRQARRARSNIERTAQCEQAEHGGDYALAMIHAQALLDLNPLSEAAHRRVIRLHYLGGDRSTALLAFDRCEQVLKDEVGVSPSADTLALLATISMAQTQALPSPMQLLPASLLRPPRLVGRSEELKALTAAWASGQTFSLSGEAGMGKSRLLLHVLELHGGAVQAQARPGDAAVPYALAARMLRAVIARVPDALSTASRADLARVLPEVDSALVPALNSSALNSSALYRPEAQKLLVQRGVVSLMQASAQAGLSAILLDDLHFADDASLELLMLLARPGTLAGLRWGFAQRPMEGSPMVKALHDALLEEHHLVAIQLPPLTVAQLADLVTSLGVQGFEANALALQLRQRTGGNPLFVLETLRQVWLEAAHARLDGYPFGDLGVQPALPRPVSVLQLLERRMSRLSPAALNLARCAAVAGPDFSIDLASHSLGLRVLELADPWAELEAAQVFRDGAFAHDLIFEAALASLPPMIAQHLHREVAAFLQARQVEPARLAVHWQLAHAWSQAGAVYREAAQRAATMGRHREELAFLEQAVLCLAQAGDTQGVFQSLLDKALALCHVDFGFALHEALDEAARCAHTPTQQLELAAQRAKIYDLIDDPRAMQAAREGLALARKGHRMDLQVQCAMSLAYQLANERLGQEALALLEPLVRWVHANQSLVDRYEFEMTLAFTLDYAGQLDQSLTSWDRARSLAEQAGQPSKLAQALSNKAATLAKMGKVHQSAELGGAALAIRRAEPGLSGVLMTAQMIYAHRLRDLGRYTEALPLLEEALQCFRDAQAASGLRAAEHRLAQTYMFLGQPARAKALLEADADSADKGTRVMRWVYRAEMARLLGLDAATPVREALLLMADQPEDVYYRIVTLFASACLSAEEGEPLAASLADWAARQNRLGLAMSGHVRAGAAALNRGAPDRAAVHARAALKLARGHQPDSFYQGELWLVAAQAFRATGSKIEAQAALVEGRTWVMRVHDTHVPPEFQSSFLHRNPVNRDLLALACP